MSASVNSPPGPATTRLSVAPTAKMQACKDPPLSGLGHDTLNNRNKDSLSMMWKANWRLKRPPGVP